MGNREWVIVNNISYEAIVFRIMVKYTYYSLFPMPNPQFPIPNSQFPIPNSRSAITVILESKPDFLILTDG